MTCNCTCSEGQNLRVPHDIADGVAYGTLQKIGGLLGLSGTFMAHYGTDHIIQAIKDLYPGEDDEHT